MRPRHLLSTLLAAALAGCGANGIASTPSSNSGAASLAPAAPANNGARDFLARSGFLGFSSVTDKALGQNRYLVFTTRHKLLTADTNGKEDVYLRDLRTGKLELISVSSSEAQGNGASNSGSISADGRYVAFRSAATNLVAGDNNGLDDIFVRDVLLGTTVRVSVSSSGTESNGASLAPAISNKNGVNGPYVVFSSTATNLVATDSNGASDIFVRDIAGNATTLVSSNSAQTNSANGGSFDPAITPDGALIAFSTDATNVLSGTLNGQRQVVRIDRATPSTRVLISQSASGNQADRPCYEPSMSDNGQVAFFTLATNLDVAADTNGFFDVYVRDVGVNSTTRASVDSTGGESDGHSGFPSISGDGTVVAFASLATDLVAGDTNGVFDVFSRTGGATTRTSVSTAGTEANVDSDLPAISQDGRHIAFRSAATNLITADPLADDDISVRDRTTPSTFWGTVRCLFPAVWPGFADMAGLASITAQGVTTGDFNGDGNLDIATVVNSAVRLYLGDGAGGFGTPTTFPADVGVTGIEADDFNNDGNLDLVVANGSQSISVFLGNGLGGFSAGNNFNVGTNPSSVTTCDINRDGQVDLVVTNGNVSVLNGNGDGSFIADTNSPSLVGSTAVTVNDFNKDGNLDIATFTNAGVLLFLNTGAGSFASATLFGVGSAPSDITSGDFDVDGNPDIAVTNFASDNVSVLLGNGAGSFTPATNFNVGDSPSSITTADFDGDGDVDLATANRASLNYSLLVNDGAGSFAATNITSGSPTFLITTCDFDNDGDHDIVTTAGVGIRPRKNLACP
jgi:hypothetical protein